MSRSALTLHTGTAMLCRRPFISRRVRVTCEAGSRRSVSVASSHGPAKPALCRYLQGKLVNIESTCNSLDAIWSSILYSVHQPWLRSICYMLLVWSPNFKDAEVTWLFTRPAQVYNDWRFRIYQLSISFASEMLIYLSQTKRIINNS